MPFSKKKIKTLHQLGKCYLLPGVDYLDYSYHGVALPRFLLTIAFVDYALVKELKMAETLRAQGPPQVRLLMASDWPSDVQVPSKRVLCASAQHKRFATTLFASVPGTHFSLSGNPQIFFIGVSFLLFRCSCLLCFCVCPGLASPFCLRGLGVPGFALFLSGRWVVPCLLCLGLPSRACVFPVFWISRKTHGR